MISAWLTDTVEHFAYEEQTDGYGNPIGGGYATQGNLSARIRPLSGDHRLSKDKDTVFAEYKVYLEPAAAVVTGDKLRWDSKDYEIKAVINPMNMNRFLQVEVSLDV